MLSMKAELAHLKSGGSIVNAASVSGYRALNRSTAYTASKHGVIGLTKTAAVDMGARGIRVNAVAPGYVDTPMLDRATAILGPEPFEGEAKQKALGRLIHAEEIAKTIVFLLSDDASATTGATYNVDGGWLAGK